MHISIIYLLNNNDRNNNIVGRPIITIIAYSQGCNSLLKSGGGVAVVTVTCQS